MLRFSRRGGKICFLFLLGLAVFFMSRDRRESIGDDDDDEVELLVRHLHSQNCFVIDVGYLESLVIASARQQWSDVQFNFEYFRRRVGCDEDHRIHLAFGIKSDLVGILSLKSIYKKYGLKCLIEREYGYYENKQVPVNFYVKCARVHLQIVVFYTRGDFLWTGSVNLPGVGGQSFGDVPRAFQNFDLDMLVDANYNILFIPTDFRRFLYDYSHSEFIECTRADYNDSVTSERDERILDSLRYLSSTLESMFKNYWLTSGSLLGWYRDCTLIEFTTDVDIAMNVEDYDERIARIFSGNNRLYTFLTISSVDSGYEMRLSDHFFTYDLFFLYKLNETHRWSGFYVDKTAYKAIYSSFDRLCSAQIGNSKFIVRCDPLKAVVDEYGAEWMQPKSEGYSWANLDEGSCRNYTEAEWQNLFKEYDLFGNLKGASF